MLEEIKQFIKSEINYYSNQHSFEFELGRSHEAKKILKFIETLENKK